jgi:hypothetical protein
MSDTEYVAKLMLRIDETRKLFKLQHSEEPEILWISRPDVTAIENSIVLKLPYKISITSFFGLAVFVSGLIRPGHFALSSKAQFDAHFGIRKSYSEGELLNG